MSKENEWIYFIGKNVPSSKNSRLVTGKRVIKSKLCQEYTKWAESLFRSNYRKWKEQMDKTDQRPLEVELYFYRDSRRKWDFVNIVQIIADLMQKYGYILNDDTTLFIPLYRGEEVVPKNNSGFMMRIKND